ncbi:hypothetical protein MMC34_007981 [Xylographa carneopallida]|nr:hypothetical protein [Xylographa carneopallida]
MSYTRAYLDRAKEYAAIPPHGSPYSVALAGSELPDRSPVYRHWRSEHGLLDTLDPHVLTAHEMFEHAVFLYPDARCLGHRPFDTIKQEWGPYQWMDYKTVHRRKTQFGAGIVELHKRADITDDKYGVGLWCQNRPEWQLTDLACMSQSLFSVSLYDTLGPSATEYIINHATLACVATSLPHIATLLKLKPRLPSLKIIISLDPLNAGEQPGLSKFDILSVLAADLGIEIMSIDQVEALGVASGHPVRPPVPLDIVTINYTSGTTGNPKGVSLTHRAAVAATSGTISGSLPIPTKDSMCSYLPLAHIYGRMLEHGAMWSGCGIGAFHGDVLGLVDDLKLLRPTTFASVPRLFNRFGGAIRTQTTEQTGVKGALSRHVVSTKSAYLEDPESVSATNKHAFYDRIWSNKVAAAVGLDRARVMVSGSAPLDPSLHQFLRIVFANDFFQGYGLTESYAVGLCQLYGDFSAGNCGAAMPANELCLLSVPDMEYHVTDKPHARGELLMRGNTMFSGYYRNEEETAKAMTADGWFKTGDIASVDERGRFKIIDRRKNVLKLAQGEYISPEAIENVYLSHLNFLATAYVHGDSVQTFLVAIFGVAPDTFAPFASKILGKTVAPTDLQALSAACWDPKVRKEVVRELDRVGRKNKFAGYERVKNCYLYIDPFTIENELLTPTLKLKRPQTAKKFRSQLDELYAEALADPKQKSRL